MYMVPRKLKTARQRRSMAGGQDHLRVEALCTQVCETTFWVRTVVLAATKASLNARSAAVCRSGMKGNSAGPCNCGVQRRTRLVRLKGLPMKLQVCARRQERLKPHDVRADSCRVGSEHASPSLSDPSSESTRSAEQVTAPLPCG